MSRFRPSEQIVSRMKMFFQGSGTASSSAAAGNLSSDAKEKRRRGRSRSPEAERREAARRYVQCNDDHSNLEHELHE